MPRIGGSGKAGAIIDALAGTIQETLARFEINTLRLRISRPVALNRRFQTPRNMHRRRL